MTRAGAIVSGHVHIQIDITMYGFLFLKLFADLT